MMHNTKVLSYAINLESIGLPTYTIEERNKCINNIAKIICQKGLTFISEVDPKIGINIYGCISLQEIKQTEWEILKDEINKIEPAFLENYNIFTSYSNLAGLVTMINKNLYQIKINSTTESLLLGENLPYHFFVLNDISGYDLNINKIVYINLELPKNELSQANAINTLKTKLDSLDKNLVGSYRIILSGKFNNENPESIPGFNKLIDDFWKNSLTKGPNKLLTSTLSNDSRLYVKSLSHVFDNYNKFLVYDTLTDLSDFTTDKILLSINLPLFVKLEIINVIEYDFTKVESKYSKLVNVDFVISHINNLETFVAEFKEALSKFKSVYSSFNEDISEKIHKMEKSIEKSLTNQRNLQLFNEIHVFNNPIKEYSNTIFGSTITETTVFGSKDSASDSLILKAKYNGKPVFIKMFSQYNTPFMKDNPGLIYEQCIYKYLMERNDAVKPYYEDYFVKVYDVFKIKYSKFFDQMETLGIQIKGGPASGKIYYSRYRQNTQNYTMPQIFAGKDQMVYFTVTEDIQGETYNSFFNKHLDSEENIIESLFDILYGVYLLNTRLGIIHGDNHFDNILIKPEKKTREYIIDKTSLIRESKYRVCLYDFDLSYMFDHENKALNNPINQNIGRINIQNNAKDIWTIINNIGYIFKYNPATVNPVYKPWYDNMQNNFFGRQINTQPYVKTYIFDMIHNVFLQTREQSDNLYENFQAHLTLGKFWNSFCKLPVSSTCVQPVYPELHPELVIKRYIIFYKNILKFIDANAYYKKYFIKFTSSEYNLNNYKNKYLKYKEKYIKLKSVLKL